VGGAADDLQSWSSDPEEFVLESKSARADDTPRSAAASLLDALFTAPYLPYSAPVLWELLSGVLKAGPTLAPPAAAADFNALWAKEAVYHAVGLGSAALNGRRRHVLCVVLCCAVLCSDVRCMMHVMWCGVVWCCAEVFEAKGLRFTQLLENVLSKELGSTHKALAPLRARYGGSHHNRCLHQPPMHNG
jgi:hypothetical protein